jgi:hypothetical protein
MDFGTAMFFTDYSMTPVELGQALEAQREDDNRQNGQPTGPHVLLQMTFRCRRI